MQPTSPIPGGKLEGLADAVKGISLSNSARIAIINGGLQRGQPDLIPAFGTFECP
jgi:hypothetical protein